MFLVRLFLIVFSLPAFGSVPTHRADWESLGTKKGVELYRRDSPGDVVELKGVGTIEAPLWRVAATLLDTERAPEWVDSLEQSSVVRRIDLNTYVEYNRIGTPFFLKDRDFVSTVKIEVDPHAKTFALRYESADESIGGIGDKGHIRGEIKPAVFKLTAVDANRTQLSGEIHCDPKGTIPKWLVNFFQKDWALVTVTALREQTAKPEVRIPAEFADVLRPTLSF
jgi:hypothetical protein